MNMFEVRIEWRGKGMWVRPVEVMQYTLAASRMAHDDELVVASIFGGFIILDILCARGNFIRVSIKVPEPPL